MNRTRQMARIWLIVAVVGLSGTKAHAGYSFQQVQVSGSADTELYGINSHGLISGLYGDSSGGYHGLLYQKGIFTTVDVPGNLNGVATYLYAGNDAGVVAGAYTDSIGLTHGLIYTSASASFTLLPEPTAASMSSFAGSITNNGLVFGNWADNVSFLNNHGWVYALSKGTYTFFNAPTADPNGFGTVTQAANNAGTVVGYVQNVSGFTDGYFRTLNGTINTVDVPGALSTALFGINDAGVMVGQYLAADHSSHGFLDDHGVITTLDAPAYSRTELTAIGNNGVILGVNYPDPLNGPFVAFIATPQTVPEPSSLALMAGMVGISLAGRAWRQARSKGNG